MTLLVVAVTTVSMAAWSLTIHRHALEEAVVLRGETIVTSLAGGGRYAIQLVDREALDNLCVTALHAPDVVATAFLDATGEPLLMRTRAGEAVPPLPAAVGEELRGDRPVVHRTASGWLFLTSIVASHEPSPEELLLGTGGGESQVGTALLWFSDAGLRAALRRDTAGLAGITVAAVVLALIVARLLSRGLVRPMARLTEGAQRLAAGDLDHRVPESGDAEVATLARTVNRMAGEIQSHLAERERRAAEIGRANDFLESVLDSSPTGIAACDPEGNMTAFSAAAEVLTGLAKRQVLGRPVGVLPEPFATLLRRASAGEAVSDTLERGEGDAASVLDLHAVGIRGERRIGGGLLLLVDRSERTRLERQLLQAQKMESVGTLAGGIAHDFNNLLTSILGNVSFLRTFDELPADVEETLGQIERSGMRAAELTGQLLAFARGGKYRQEPVELHQLVRTTVEMVRGALGHAIDLHLDFAAPRACVLGDAGQLQQVLTNLLVNARDAMADGGWIRIATRPGVGESVELTCQDSGSGIPEPLRERIFEPFYTTKEVGKGTGLGLAMVYGIVHNHGGTVRVSGAEGEGACFTITLPVCDHPAAAPPPPPATPATAVGGGRRVLLVDDEAVVREVGRRILARIGFEVVTAEDGEVAVATFRREAGRFDLCLIDLTMPALGGREVVSVIRDSGSTVPILLVSGHSEDGEVERSIECGANGFLAKPYTVAELSAEVTRVLHPAANA